MSTAAHLLTQQTRRDVSGRYAAKWRLARLLYERDWDRQRNIDLFSIIDWMMRLPDDLQQTLWHELEQLEANKQMPYMTSIERIGMEKGVQQGKQLGSAAVLERLIERRFGPLSASLRERLAQADTETLLVWSERILDARTLEDVLH
jgi:hypothetical protein